MLTCTAAGTEAIEQAAAYADIIVVGDESVDLAAALDALAHHLDHRDQIRVLTEGGPALLGELISSGLLDELRLTLAPVVGGDPLPITSGVDLTTFTLAEVRQDGDHLFLRYLTREADRA